ncbi:MAG: hypothetical protein RBR86_06150 [Pseudobdellovibrionaceae bacterium]|jgi:hypothetical protein|nr:hypothetical protein [Pseudobdellovibrionaceae bacterium]
MKKWIIRLLLTIIILCGIFIGGLKLISGTGDTQKTSLENAFSSSTGGVVQFGKLLTFNIFPDLIIEVENFMVSYDGQDGDIKADHINLSFGLFDLLAKNRRIKDFSITNMTIQKGKLMNEYTVIETGGIETPADAAPYYKVIGKYNSVPMSLTLNMILASPTIPPSFSFGNENPFILEIGATKLTGVFSPYVTDNASLINLSVERDGIKCTSLPKENRYTMMNFTGYVFSTIASSDILKTDLEIMCKELTRYGL